MYKPIFSIKSRFKGKFLQNIIFEQLLYRVVRSHIIQIKYFPCIILSFELSNSQLWIVIHLNVNSLICMLILYERKRVKITKIQN